MKFSLTGDQVEVRLAPTRLALRKAEPLSNVVTVVLETKRGISDGSVTRILDESVAAPVSLQQLLKHLRKRRRGPHAFWLELKPESIKRGNKLKHTYRFANIKGSYSSELRGPDGFLVETFDWIGQRRPQ